MSAREWKPGDRALLPVTVDGVDVGMDRVIRVALPGGLYAEVDPEDLIPDDRRPSWLPGQPGDVAEWGGERWAARDDGDGVGHYWVRLTGEYGAIDSDADVPADAVLVLPAKTREATP